MTSSCVTCSGIQVLEWYFMNVFVHKILLQGVMFPHRSGVSSFIQTYQVIRVKCRSLTTIINDPKINKTHWTRNRTIPVSGYYSVLTCLYAFESSLLQSPIGPGTNTTWAWRPSETLTTAINSRLIRSYQDTTFTPQAKEYSGFMYKLRLT